MDRKIAPGRKKNVYRYAALFVSEPKSENTLRIIIYAGQPLPGDRGVVILG